MSRVLEIVVCAVVLCAAAADASARRAACDEDDAPISLLPELLRSPAPEARPATDEPRPPDTRICVAGATDDPSCRPLSSLPSPGRTALSLFSDTFVVVRAPALPLAAVRRLPYVTDDRLELAPGFAPRLERPPRSVPVFA
jgi:hypothetical protein